MNKREKINRSQAISCARHIHTVCKNCFESGKPADRILSAHFKRNRNCGSKDRRIISETAFSLFRWWGWMMMLISEDEFHEEEAYKSKKWFRLLFTASILDTNDKNPVIHQWKNMAKVREFVPEIADQSIEKKGIAIAELYDLQEEAFQMENLIPYWYYNELDIPKKEFRKIIESLQKRPPLWIRSQSKDKQQLIRNLIRDGFKVTDTKVLKKAINLSNPRVNLYEVDSFKNGEFEVQDIASQLIGNVCAAKPGERWWDACAGAGGKSLQLASMMKNRGHILATDIREYKLLDLKKRARRSKFFNITTKPWKSKLPVKPGSYDGVLVDAPCSCSGTWRRNPDARWTSQREDINEMAELQLDILMRASVAVKPGGVLVYATCSLYKEENIEVVNRFITNSPDFSLEPFDDPISKTKTQGFQQVLPHELNSDGTFFARFRKQK